MTSHVSLSRVVILIVDESLQSAAASIDRRRRRRILLSAANNSALELLIPRRLQIHFALDALTNGIQNIHKQIMKRKRLFAFNG